MWSLIVSGVLSLALPIAKNFLGAKVGGFVADIAKPFVDALGDERRFRHLETIESIRADVEIAQARAEVIKAEQGWWVTAMVRPAFAYPLAAYYGAVILDSLFQFSWNVAKLPEPIGEWSGYIITSYFIARSGEKISRGIMSTIERMFNGK